MQTTEALDALAEAMTPVNAGRWQVQAVTRWRAMIDWEGETAAAAGEKTSAQVEGGTEPGRHTGWQLLARQVTAELRKRERIAIGRANRFRELADRKFGQRDALMEQPDPSPKTRARAAVLEEAAKRLSEKALACNVWATAAGEAASYGRRLTRRADKVHLPVGRALARTPRGWVPEDKTWITAGS